MWVDHAEVKWGEGYVGVSDGNEHGSIDLCLISQADVPL